MRVANVAECPSFDLVLARLMERRGLDVATLAAQAGIPEAGLRAVLTGKTPDVTQLRRLAPALRMHTVDVLTAAWADLPDDLVPLDRRAYGWLPHLAGHCARLPPGQVRQLRKRAQQMPQEAPPYPPRPLRPARELERSPGRMLLRLFENRNLGISAGHVIMAVTGRGLSSSTVIMAGYNRKPLSSEEFADYIAVLDISTGDLAAMTGVEASEPVRGHPPGTAETARLIWDVRRLSTDQVRLITEEAKRCSQPATVTTPRPRAARPR